MAKKIKILYDRTNDYLKKYQSGFDTVVDFNGKFYQVQYEFANYLISILGTNERAAEYLSHLILTDNATASAGGVIPKPTDFMHYLSASYLGKPVHNISPNQIDTYELIPQRRGSLAKKRVNITGISTGWEARPATAFDIKVRYVKQPPAASIVFTEQETSNEYVLVYNDASTVDFIWTEDCMNILLFMMLEKIGIAVREQLLNEYAQLGLAREAIK